MPLLRLKHVHVFLSLTPLPPAHTQRGYDQADYKAGQRHRYFKVIILQPPRMSMDIHTNASWILAILSPPVVLTSANFLGGENKHGQCFPKGELSSSENPCDKLPEDLPENFTGISFFFFELTFSENFVLQTSGNPCTLKQTPFWTGPRITLTLRSLHGINANFLH